MKILHQNGYTRTELINWKKSVYCNVIQSAQAIAKALKDFGYQQHEKMQNELQIISNYAQLDELNPDLVRAIVTLWKDPATRSLLTERSSEFYLMDSAPYFFDEVERISQPEYIPIYNDVLRVRVKTTGISETTVVRDKFCLRMFDVGGQRSERKKWIHCFEAVHSIVFCVSTSEYDQVLLEERQQNRLLESLTLFESIVNSRWFVTTTIILFLNKMDIFEEKIKRVPMEKYFPDYGGGIDRRKALRYILWRFQQTNRANLKIYPQ
ncbi:guanine nucleotide binding protein, alpha subunit [Sporodiniella umbellata]|nr:guanine nucleotide binding protein, alpha subunit [Sporodiniella umbellata]